MVCKVRIHYIIHIVVAFRCVAVFYVLFYQTNCQTSQNLLTQKRHFEQYHEDQKKMGSTRPIIYIYTVF